MAGTVWLHIGTPKSGTSSLQKHLLDQRAALLDQGVAYVTPGGFTSCNDLAIAQNRGRDDLAAIAADLNAQIEGSACPLLSSEMFYGLAPSALARLLPALHGRAVKVLVYLRRQDRYIEAAYLQKAKNFRFSGSISDYIARFDGSGSNYAEMLRPWEETGWTLVPRILERDRLVGGSVVSDARAQIGLPPADLAAAEEVNVSPGYHRVQLLQAAAAAGVGDPRRLQRRLANTFPQAPDERSPVLSQNDRRAFVARYAEGNEALRARFFPDLPSLFGMADLSAEPEATGIPPFTEAQLREVTRLLQVMRTLGA